MRIVRTSGRLSRLLLTASLLGAFLSGGERCGAHEVLAKALANLRWHAPAKSITVTFLGKDEKETAVLVVKKAAVLDTEISIRSDATTITIVSGGSIRIPFTVDVSPDGTTSRLNLGAGDSPKLLFNDNEDPDLRAKWIKVVNSKEENLSIELTDATTATVKFDPKSIEKGAAIAAAAPADPGASAPADPAAGADGAKPAEGGAHPAAAAELLHPVPPATLKRAAFAFADGVSHRCIRCSGTGHITVSVQYGTRQEGSLIRPLMRDEVQICKTCNGAGKLRDADPALRRLAANFVKAMAAVKRDAPDTQEVLSGCYKMITDVMIGDENTWILMTETGRGVLSQRSPAPGTPVIVKVHIKQMSSPAPGKREFVVTVLGLDQDIRVIDPVSADEVDSGPALVGGLLEPPLAGDRMMVLARGFLVAPPIDRSWWWWYGVRPRAE